MWTYMYKSWVNTAILGNFLPFSWLSNLYFLDLNWKTGLQILRLSQEFKTQCDRYKWIDWSYTGYVLKGDLPLDNSSLLLILNATSDILLLQRVANQHKTFWSGRGKIYCNVTRDAMQTRNYIKDQVKCPHWWSRATCLKYTCEIRWLIKEDSKTLRDKPDNNYV